MITCVTGRAVVPGVVTGPALCSPATLSFLGDVDIKTGEIVNVESPIRGRSIAGRILVAPATVGSAGAWRFVYQLYVHGTHPLGIVLDGAPDPSLVQGAILAGIPVLCDTARSVVTEVRSDDTVTLDCDRGVITFAS